MTDDLVTRIRTVFEDTPEVLEAFAVETYAGAEAYTHMLGMWQTMKEAADRIEELKAVLQEKDNIAYIIDGHGISHNTFTIVYWGKKND